MAGEKPSPKEATAEGLLGLKSRLIESTSPLPRPETCKKYERVVTATWPEAPGFSGGEIRFSFAERVAIWGGLAGERPKIIGSYFEVNRSFTGEPAPAGREGVAALLTMIATINETARKLRQPLLHVARGGENSLSYLERLREAGLYRYCDHDGKPSPHRVIVDRYTLFSCEYPVEGLDAVVGKFTAGEAADLLTKVYQELGGKKRLLRRLGG